MKHGLGVGSVSLLFVLQALVAAACGDEGGEPGPGTGACCTNNQCTVVSASACGQMDGAYRGDGVACETNTCGALGACFGANGVCTMTTAAQCPPPMEYGGAGSTCPPPA